MGWHGLFGATRASVLGGPESGDRFVLFVCCLLLLFRPPWGGSPAGAAGGVARPTPKGGLRVPIELQEEAMRSLRGPICRFRPGPTLLI